MLEEKKKLSLKKAQDYTGTRNALCSRRPANNFLFA